MDKICVISNDCNFCNFVILYLSHTLKKKTSHLDVVENIQVKHLASNQSIPNGQLPVICFVHFPIKCKIGNWRKEFSILMEMIHKLISVSSFAEYERGDTSAGSGGFTVCAEQALVLHQ